MRTIVLLGILLALSGAAAITQKRRIEEALPLTVVGVILILYISGFVTGGLQLGLLIVYLLAGMCLCYCAFRFTRDSKGIAREVLTPGLLIFILLFSFLWLIHRYRLFSQWDEFSHWGLAVKNMACLDSFCTNPDSTVTFRGYPPAATLWQYFVIKTYGRFYEGHAYQAMSWMLISFMAPVFKGFTWRDLKKILIACLLVVCVPFIFYPNYLSTIYVDALLGIVFAYVLWLYYSEGFGKAMERIVIPMTVCMLTLIKASGVGLAVIASVIITADSLANGGKKQRQVLHNLWLYAPLFMGIAVGHFSWKLHLKLSGTGKAWDTSGVVLERLVDFIRGGGESYQYQTWVNFFRALAEKDFSGYVFQMTFIIWLILALGIAFALKKTIVRSKYLNTFNTVTGGVLAGSIVYTCGLLILYLFTYSAYEAENLASFNRYLSTYLTGVYYFFAAVYITENAADNERRAEGRFFAAALVLLFLTPLTPLFNITVLNRNEVKATQGMRAPFERIGEYSSMLKSTDQIYCISQNSAGFEYGIVYYSFTPYRVSVQENGAWSLGKRYSEEDMYTVDYTCEEWARLLREQYDYVYLSHIDDQFLAKYGSLLEESGKARDGDLYQVVPLKTSVLLKKVTLEQEY